MTGISAQLQRHPKSGILYFRLAVPRRLWAVLHKRELKRSLRTARTSFPAHRPHLFPCAPPAPLSLRTARTSEAVPLALAAYLAALKLFNQATRNAVMPKNPKEDKQAPAPWTPEWIWVNAQWRWNRDETTDPDATEAAQPTTEAAPPDRQAGGAVPAPAPSPAEPPEPDRQTAEAEAFRAAMTAETEITSAMLQKIHATLADGTVLSIDNPKDEKRIIDAMLLQFCKTSLTFNAPGTSASTIDKSIRLSKLISSYTEEVKRTEKQSDKTQKENAAYYQLLIEIIGNMPVEKSASGKRGQSRKFC